MAEHAEHELIIVRRHEEEEHEAHSSAWKVAHADFMTAMMAFFLIMWLISVTDDQIRKGISEYFNPIRLSQGQTELKGLNQPTTDPNKPGVRKGHADAPADVFNPMKLSQGLSESKALAESEAAATPAESVASEAAAGAGAAPAPAAAAGEGAAAGTEAGEGAAFRNPYALLDDLAASYRAAHPGRSSAGVGDDRSLGIDGSEVDRDPFDPVYWQLGTTPAARTETPGKPGTAKAPPDTLPDATAAKPAELADAAGQAGNGAAPVPASAAADEAAKPAAANTMPPPASVPAATAAGVPKAVASPAAPADSAAGGETTGENRPAATGTVAAATRTNAAAIGAEVATVVASLDAADLPDVTVTATPEGVLVNLTDDADFAMFEIGSAVPNAKIVVLMEALGKALAARSGDVIVRGYTDGRPFRSEVYDNWRLSAARAQMAYYMLTRGGLDEKRVVRIEGYADRDLKVKADPFAAENRRIEILLREGGQ